MKHVTFPYILVFSQRKQEGIVLRNPLVFAMFVAVFTPARPAFGLRSSYSVGIRPVFGQDCPQ
ncbi:hypothetical protein ABLO26_01215 [Neobacillus sp. 179-J 1A1 HS]